MKLSPTFTVCSCILYILSQCYWVIFSLNMQFFKIVLLQDLIHLYSEGSSTSLEPLGFLFYTLCRSHMMYYNLASFVEMYLFWNESHASEVVRTPCSPQQVIWSRSRSRSHEILDSFTTLLIMAVENVDNINRTLSSF